MRVLGNTFDEEKKIENPVVMEVHHALYMDDVFLAEDGEEKQEGLVFYDTDDDVWVIPGVIKTSAIRALNELLTMGFKDCSNLGHLQMIES